MRILHFRHIFYAIYRVKLAYVNFQMKRTICESLSFFFSFIFKMDLIVHGATGPYFPPAQLHVAQAFNIGNEVVTA